MQGRFWPIAVVSLCLLLLAGVIGQVAGSFTDSETSVGSSFQAWTSNLWLQTTQADFEYGVVPTQADTRSSHGDVGLARDSGVFAFRGGGTPTFWRYAVPANSWVSMTAPPNAVGAGGALAFDGVQYIYALRGNNSRTFWRYDTLGGTWGALANAPAIVGAANRMGGALAYIGPQYVYALRGSTQTAFWRYDITANSWTTMSAVPQSVGAGGALAYDGSGYIYAFQGAGSPNFWRYSIAGNSWTRMTNAPGRVNGGGALAYGGLGYIYAFRGGNSRVFWRYDITGNTWTVMAPPPARVNTGGALTYDGLGHVYGLGGGGATAFWRYDVLSGTWTTMAVALGTVNAGGALAFVPASTYVTSATMASQVLDTGIAGDRWDALIWDEMLPSVNTDITFEVRASDVLFAADDAVLAWIPVGSTSPLGSGLPAGQYKQWRATLTTSDIAVTPLLNEVRVYHY